MGDASMDQLAPSELGDVRRHRRYAVSGGIFRVAWLDVTGKMRVTRTRALNISEGGMALRMSKPPIALLIQFQSDRFNIKAVGAVRHYREVGDKFVVGLQFSSNLRWRAPEGPVREPISLCYPEFQS
jgi:hypothetical protein